MRDTATDVVAFWREAGPERWFEKDAAFDARFRGRFLDTHFAAARGELDAWRTRPDGVLALLLLLDQFPRNAFRGSAHLYATDPLARHYAARAIEAGHDLAIDEQIRVFFYLPFEHSEDIADQKLSVELHKANAASYLEYAVDHYDIIERFGRFPHRNGPLGRETTPEEKAFLENGGFAG